MKNLIPYQGDSFEFHKEVISKKHSGEIKSSMTNNLHLIKQSSDHYDFHFSRKTLSIINITNSNIDKYNTLYKYSSSCFVNLTDSLTTNENGRMVLCQYCTINSVNSLDHIAPQDNYGAYIIHPLNLFPSCSECNGYKNNRYLFEEQCHFPNLYLDTLPNEQYLFVEINLGNQPSSTEIKYYLKNTNGIELVLFDKLNRHYTDLHLFDRFLKCSYVEISLMKAIFENNRDHFTIEQTINFINFQISQEKQYYGANYWKSIFKSALISSEDFLIDFM